MTLEERKTIASAFMEQQYKACLYELNLKPSELVRIILNVLKKQQAWTILEENFTIIDKNYDDVPCHCPFIKKSERIKL